MITVQQPVHLKQFWDHTSTVQYSSQATTAMHPLAPPHATTSQRRKRNSHSSIKSGMEGSLPQASSPGRPQLNSGSSGKLGKPVGGQGRPDPKRTRLTRTSAEASDHSSCRAAQWALLHCCTHNVCERQQVSSVRRPA